MANLWSCLLTAFACLCVVHMKPLEDETHRALLRTGYIYFPNVGYYRLAKRPESWGDARRNCQQEGATLSIVNSESEAEVLRSLYLNYGLRQQTKDYWYGTTSDWRTTNTPAPTPTEEPASNNGSIHVGFHDLFIEGEYLSLHSEPIIMTGFVRWKPGYPLSDDKNNCGAFDINGYILDIPCSLQLPYVCEIPEP